MYSPYFALFTAILSGQMVVYCAGYCANYGCEHGGVCNQITRACDCLFGYSGLFCEIIEPTTIAPSTTKKITTPALATTCPPLIIRFPLDKFNFIEKYDGSQWAVIPVDSPEIVSWQPAGSSYWIGCSNGDMILQYCQQTYGGRGAAYWYPQDNCSKSFAPDTTPLLTTKGSAISPERMRCSPLIRQMSFDGVVSMEKYADERAEWNKLPLDSTEFMVTQPVGAEFWLTCKSGDSFSKSCYSDTKSQTTYWYPSKDCSSEPTITMSAAEGAKTEMTRTSAIPTQVTGGVTEPAKCPPLSTQTISFTGVLKVRQYDETGNVWQDRSLDSMELWTAQPGGTAFWVYCESGENMQTKCNLDDTGETPLATWFPDGKCHSIAPSQWTRSDQCAPLVMQHDLSFINSINQYSQGHWEKVDFESTEMARGQAPGSVMWIGCNNSASFTQTCKQGEDGKPAYWSPQQECEETTPLSWGSQTATCLSLPSQLTMKGVDWMEKYEIDNPQWAPVTPGLTELWTPQIVGNSYWVGCTNGDNFAVQCSLMDDESVMWYPEDQDCPAPQTVTDTTPLCRALTSQLVVDDIASVQKLQPQPTSVAIDSIDLSTWQPVGTRYWIECDNGATYMQTCEKSSDKSGTAAEWTPRKASCTNEPATSTAPNRTPPPNPGVVLTTRTTPGPALPTIGTPAKTPGVISGVDPKTVAGETKATPDGLNSPRISTNRPGSGNSGPIETKASGGSTPEAGASPAQTIKPGVPTVKAGSTPKATTKASPTGGSATPDSAANPQAVSPVAKPGTYIYQVESQLTVKRIYVKAPTVVVKVNGSRRRRQVSENSLSELTPQNFIANADSTNAIYNEAKTTMIEKFDEIYQQADLTIPITQQNLTNIKSTGDGITAELSAQVRSKKPMTRSEMEASVQSAASKMAGYGNFEGTFGKDGVFITVTKATLTDFQAQQQSGTGGAGFARCDSGRLWFAAVILYMLL